MKQLLLFFPLLILPWCFSAQGLFTKVAGNPAVSFANTAANYKGAAWIDLDHDNWPDLFVSQRFLFHNTRDGSFEQLTDLTYVHACCTFHPSGPFTCRLYLQGTDGSFSQTTGYDFTGQNAPYTIPVWSDYDLDGDVDLFIGAGPAAGQTHQNQA